MKKVKIEVKERYDESVQIGDIYNMNINSAVEFEKEGYVKILDNLPKKDRDKAHEHNNKVINLPITQKDYEKFIDYLDHKVFWLEVFKPEINGEKQTGLMYRAFHTSKKKLKEDIEKYNEKGLVCLALNEHKKEDTTLYCVNQINSIVVDIDVKKRLKEGYVSQKQHHELAIKQAKEITEYLSEKGFKVSMIVDSGNGAHIYLSLRQPFSEDFILKRDKILSDLKDKLHLIEYKNQLQNQYKELLEKEDIYQTICSFELEIKKKFSTDILDVDNITKDFNRRMKIPGVLNLKDLKQRENRYSKILFFDKDYDKNYLENQNNLAKYKKNEINSPNNKINVPTEIISNDKLQTIKRFNFILQNKKENKMLIDTYEAKNLQDDFAGDRSSAEQYVVNSIIFKGFTNYEEVNHLMMRCSIGKWQEEPEQYRQITFRKGLKLYEQKQEEKKTRKSKITEYFKSLEFFLLVDEPKTKYIIYDPNNQTYCEKHGNDSFSDYLYSLAITNKVNLEDLSLFYFDSKKSQQSQLLDFIKEQGLITLVNNVNFKPINERVYREDNKTFFNVYTPNEFLALSPDSTIIDLKNDVPNIYTLLWNITGEQKQGFDYLINLLSFMLKNPHIKTGKLIVFFGEEAAGKGIFYNEILKKLFSKYAIMITERDLEDKYNGFLSQKLAVFINEISSNKKYENTLKNWTVEQEQRINNKYGSDTNEKTYCTIFADVNGDNPLFAGERRGVYFKSRTLGGNQIKATEIGSQLVENIPKEINSFAQYLINQEVDYSLISKGYDSVVRKDIMDKQATIEQRFVDEMFSYKDLESFVNVVNSYEFNKFNGIFLGNYIKDNFIEVELFLNLYNSFRKKHQIKDSTLNRFSWFYDKLNIDRNNVEHFKRNYNENNKNVYWVNATLIGKEFNRRNSEVDQNE